MKPGASRSLALAKAAALAIVRAHGHANAAAAEAADDREAVANAAAAAQAFGPPESGETGSEDTGGSDTSRDAGASVASVAEQVRALDVQSSETPDGDSKCRGAPLA